MKISDITQRSQVQHIAEGRKQLDEFGFVGMGIGGAASYALLAAQYGANPLTWPKSAYAEFALDVGLGAVTGGTLTLAKAAAVAAAKTAAKKTAASAAQKVGKLTGMGKGPGTVNKKTGFLRGADGKDTVLKKGDKGFKKAQDQIKKSKQKPDDGIPTMKKEFGKQVKGKGIGKQLSRGVALSPLAQLARGALGYGDVLKTDAQIKARDKAEAAAELKRKLRFSGPSSHRSGVGVIGQDQYDITSQNLKKYEKEYKAAENAAKEAEKEAAEAAEAAKAEKAAAAATAEKQANQQDQSKEK